MLLTSIKFRAGLQVFNTFSQGSTSDDSAQLGLANLGGVFIVLLGGMITACIIAVGEFMWENRLLIADENVSCSVSLIFKVFRLQQ